VKLKWGSASLRILKGTGVLLRYPHINSFAFRSTRNYKDVLLNAAQTCTGHGSDLHIFHLAATLFLASPSRW
jgi:hypothetical protein